LFSIPSYLPIPEDILLSSYLYLFTGKVDTINVHPTSIQIQTRISRLRQQSANTKHLLRIQSDVYVWSGY